jgi:hypothetical protein
MFIHYPFSAYDQSIKIFFIISELTPSRPVAFHQSVLDTVHGRHIRNLCLGRHLTKPQFHTHITNPNLCIMDHWILFENLAGFVKMPR